MITYLPLNYHTPVLSVPNIFTSESTSVTYIDVGLQKAHCLSLRVIIHFPYF